MGLSPLGGMPNMTNTSPKPKTSGFLSGLGGLASIAAPILGNVIGNIGRRKAEREARDYNHPAAQMARLQEAGLNPNLIYGSSPAQAAGTGQAPDYQMKISSQDILNTQTLRQITAQTQNIRAQTRLTDMNAAAVAERMPALKAEAELAMRKGLAEIGQKEAQTSLIKQQTRSAMVDAGIKTATQQDMIQRVINESLLSFQTLEGQKLKNLIDQKRADLAADNMTLNDAQWIRIIDSIVPDLRARLFGGRLFNKN